MQTGILVVAATLGMAGAAVAADAASTLKQSTYIEAQPLDRALQSLANTRELAMVYRAELVSKVQAPPVNGELTINEVLEQLLAGTRLTYKFLDEKTVTIVPVDTAASHTGQGATAVSASAPNENAGLQAFWNGFLLAQSNASSVSAYSSSEEGKAGQPGRDAGREPESLEEIIVSAQRREEVLQNVPISITVLSGKDLDSSTLPGAVEALRAVPGFDSSIGQYGGGGAYFSLRGVANGARSGGSGTVAYYIDGVPYGFIREAYYPNPGIYDLDRIEVLAGPQGTLYGANSVNGVIRVLTQDANADRFDLKARALTSMTEDGGANTGANVAVNVPLIEGKLGVRATVGYRDDSGWIDGPTTKDLNAEDARDYRLKVHVAPSDTLTIDLSAWHSETNFGAPPLSTYERRIGFDFSQPGTTEFDTYGLEVTKQFSAFSISSMTSSIDYGQDSIVYGGPACGGTDCSLLRAYLDTQYDSSVFSQEFNLVSNIDGPWRWSAGAFYRDVEDSTYQPFVFFNPDFVTINNDFSDASKSYAAYGELGRSFLNDRLSLAVGLRYFYDEETTLARKDYAGENSTIAPGTSFESTSEAVTPRAVLTWMPSENQTFYASYSQGFRSGFAQQPNVQAVFPFQPVDPDRLTNYEIGGKGSFAEGRLSYEAAVFYIDWQDVQQNLLILVPDTGSGVRLNTSATVNGESASGLGASFGFTWHAGGFELGLNGAWNDLKLDADIRDGEGQLISRKGSRLGSSPEWTLGGSTGYSQTVGRGFIIGGSVSASWKSPQNTSVFESDPDESDDILMADAKLFLKTPRHWTLSLFADNLTDENGQVVKFSPIPDWQASNRPRVIGAQLEYQW